MIDVTSNMDAIGTTTASAADASALPLFGKWESTEAFGNTSLDWSQALKDQKVQLHVAFTPQFEFSFALFRSGDAADGSAKVDVTASFRHVVAANGTYELQDGKRLKLAGIVM
jgi:hypothetical protein|uniref:Uncharacterized protein n=1 Tax=Globisporangium ultimum (strain ATCC 200006 / CBS 805.95 / DAOM BR144) TaxID=431595 RepID=K3WL91_GLOUD